MRLLSAATVALAFAGCAGVGDEAASNESPTELLAQAADDLRAQGSFSFEADYVRVRADRPDDAETFAEIEGAVELDQGRGRATVRLDLGLPSSGSEPGLDDPIDLRWSRMSLEAEVGGEAQRLPRVRARRDGGLLGRLPDEPEALAELLALGTDARLLGRRHVGFEVDVRKSGFFPGGVEGRFGEALPMEVWLDEDGVPQRILYRIEQEPTAALPARSVTATYELGDIGEPVSGLEFRSQAG